MRVFDGLEPVSVFNYFEDICRIPRSSGDRKAISDYLVMFAKERDLEVVQDEALNVIIRKKATEGKENQEGIILQAHTDIVAVCDEGVSIDFTKDGVSPYVDGDLIRAKGTTLGADDGIGMAMILAILDSKDLPHPMIEAVFTTDEEIGLIGAAAIDGTLIKSRKMINLDSEEDYQMVVGCAGGCRADISFSYKAKKEKGIEYEISIEGLNGGHSGIEINKGNANANVLMGRVLQRMSDKLRFSLISIEGGNKDNAICCACKANILIDKANENKLCEVVSVIENEIKSEYSATEHNLKVVANKLKKNKVKVLKPEDFLRVIILLTVMPDGVQKMSQYIPGLVETSLNIGVLRVGDGVVKSGYAIRSNIDAGKEWLIERVSIVAKSIGAKVMLSGEYPAWENHGTSDFANKIADIYKRLFDKEFDIVAIHAGLECGLFYKKLDGLDAVSIGPSILGAHTTSENVSISSVERIWKLLTEVLDA